MRRRKKFDLYIFLFLLIATITYFTYNHYSSENRGISIYKTALTSYKAQDYETAYKEFGRIPSGSSLKEAALFRQARCATNTNRKEIAVKKYNRIIHSNSKSSIIPISEYNMANLLFELKDDKAKKHFEHIIKKYPTSDYAIASEYYLGLITIGKLPKSGKANEKAIEKALIHFKNYIEKAPSGRYSMKSAEEIKKLDKSLNNYDNLLLAKTYYENGVFEEAQKMLNGTTLSDSWTDFAKTEFKLGNKDKSNYYTEKGLNEFANSAKEEDILEVIDNYISTFSTRSEGIKSLVSKNYKSKGADYIAYLNCNELVSGNSKESCFVQFYDKYPNSKFAAEALYNSFLIKYLNKKYYDAQRDGFMHLKRFPNAKSSPAVTYYMGKIARKTKHYESANNYFKQTIIKYPDSYYAYRASYNLNKDDGTLPFLDINHKPVVFPYKKSLDKDVVIKLALLKDYDLVEELCKKDKFIQSWIAYEKQNYTISAVLARNAMDELEVKPSFNDLRWRLIYPLHYYETIEKIKGNNNPIILESILKEESHFNPYAGSSVGALGLMQLMPATYNEINSKLAIGNDAFNPESNIKAGIAYYTNLKKVLGNNDLYAISAYNGGIGSVTSWFSKLVYNDADEFVEQIPYPETKNYVKKVLRTYWVYGNIYQ